MAMRVYNTLTRKKEEFQPGHEKIGIYVCGVTPYSNTHLGHARPSVVWDAIKKYLNWRGYETFHVQNFTDIDDKIIARANEEGIPALELSRIYANDYLESMDALGVERADLYPRVSEHISDIIAMIETLIIKGHAYAVGGNVFYDVCSFPEYGKLSNQKLDDLQCGTRFEVDQNKKNPTDFALWKKVKPDEMSWDSPWGAGRPGWHIECSAMSCKYLGEEFDFHGGGCDLVFPHHENEIAQSEGATGKPLAKYWLHNGMLNLQHEKMSKSQGNFITIKSVLKSYPKELLRYYILASHYRSELEYHDQKLDEVQRGWQRLNDCINVLANMVANKEVAPVTLGDDEQEMVDKIEAAQQNFIAAMDDDFNTALAIASLFDLVHEVNKFIALGKTGFASDYVLAQAYELFSYLAGDILGIIKSNSAHQDGLTEPLMQIIMQLRGVLREQKNYELSDLIRARLAEQDIIIEDTAQGPRWKLKS